MPALKLFGRKWLAATDDLVYPGLFEIVIRLTWSILVGIGCAKYYESTWKCRAGGDLVRVYLLGEMVILGVIIILTFFIIKYSSKGSIIDTHARRYVEPLLTIKIFMILPEINWNILGTMWIFSKSMDCEMEQYTMSVVEALVFFDWILIGLTIFGLALVFDPLGSLSLRKEKLEDSIEHGKISRIWRRRFKFLWWMRKDESANETFQQVAGLLSAVFRGTDLVPSDIMAGFILLRVRRKREIHELKRLNLYFRPKYTVDARLIFTDTPSWMSLENAHHFLKLSVASYGWLFVVYQHLCTACFRLIPNLTCCGCFRKKRKVILDDNCCFCGLSGVKHISKLPDDDILFASFKNHLCEIPFYVVADHKTSSIVIVIRGSLSLRDIITDLAAAADTFECDGLPPGSMAHKGMILGAKAILKQLDHHKVLEMAFNTYPTYTLTLTGHSLGAGLSSLLGIMLRPRYPNLRVYAFSTPAGVLSRDAAKVTEEFVLTVGLGDDFAMRLTVNSAEDLRTSLIVTLEACRLPKYRVVLNGFGYALHGVPERDLNKTWKNNDIFNSLLGRSPLLMESENANNVENRILTRDIVRRRFSKVRLYNAGRILHLARCKDTSIDANSNKKKKEIKYEMRWAQPEEFMEMLIMPRMLLDHLPENLEAAVAKIIFLQELNNMSVVSSRVSSVSSILKSPGIRSQLAKQSNRVYFKLPKNIKTILFNYEAHNGIKDYDDLICMLKNPNVKDSDLVDFLSEARQCVSLLGPVHKSFIEVLLQINWTDRSPEVISIYKSFLEDLICVQVYHGKCIIDKLVEQFKPAEDDSIEWEAGEYRTKDIDKLNHIHDVLSKILKIVPMSSKLLLQSVRARFPYIIHGTHAHEVYMHALLQLLDYAPQLRSDILSLIINRLMVLDVNIPRSKANTEDVLMEDNECDDILDDDTDKNDKNKEDAKVLHPIAHTLDVCMEQILNFKISVVEAFLDWLWKKTTDPNMPQVLRHTSVSYIASLVATASFVSSGLVKIVQSKLAKWIHSYIDMQENSDYVSDDPRDHPIFYSVCQALFFIVTVRHKDFIDTKSSMMCLHELDLPKIITCKLNPLKSCQSDIVHSFADISRTYQLAYCYTIIENNVRCHLPVIHDTNSLGYMLDSFLPFSTYTLNRSGERLKLLFYDYSVSNDRRPMNDHKNSIAEFIME
ncbi:hypothetical protein KPH14_005516 [Odynerus spinipes]|uniref:sn-1-specific diacylglycerol lipase n=1 Tax=Odynerus spinipes TaxID=1348599 RepID=A0AAD9RDA1_9HYME|nr:hypothetical protein KPH14_005516 [Odynerus spinipes]